MKYVVTAISRLTGEREAITSPKGKEMAVRLCVQLKLTPARKRVWLRPRIKSVPWREEKLPFTPPMTDGKRGFSTRHNEVSLSAVTKIDTI